MYPETVSYSTADEADAATSSVLLVPSRMFAFGDHHVRIGFGREDFPQVLARFGDYLRMRFG